MDSLWTQKNLTFDKYFNQILHKMAATLWVTCETSDWSVSLFEWQLSKTDLCAAALHRRLAVTSWCADGVNHEVLRKEEPRPGFWNTNDNSDGPFPPLSSLPWPLRVCCLPACATFSGLCTRHPIPNRAVRIQIRDFWWEIICMHVF